MHFPDNFIPSIIGWNICAEFLPCDIANRYLSVIVIYDADNIDKLIIKYLNNIHP